MGESTKVACALVLIVGSVAAVVAWTGDRPDTATWAFRIGGPLSALLALGLILKLHFRPDLAPDYLHGQVGNYFNRDGFCFAFNIAVVDGIAYMEAYFQNQYDRASIGRVALRPARGFLLNRAKIETITFEMACAPAAFGVARMAIPVPRELQGKRQAFEVGASATYAGGKGRRLRFRDGVFLRTNTKFGDAFGTALIVAGAATGSLVFSKPAAATIDFPVGVADNVPGALAPEIKTLWQWGDEPLGAPS